MRKKHLLLVLMYLCTTMIFAEAIIKEEMELYSVEQPMESKL